MRSLSMYGDLWKRRRWKGFTSKKMPGTQMTLCLTQYSKKTTQLFSGGGKAETSAQTSFSAFRTLGNHFGGLETKRCVNDGAFSLAWEYGTTETVLTSSDDATKKPRIVCSASAKLRPSLLELRVRVASGIAINL